MNGAIYDPELWDTQVPANVLGGVNRCKDARRDRWGRLLPKEGKLPAPVNHGVAAGKARSAIAKRDMKGKFCK